MFPGRTSASHVLECSQAAEQLCDQLNKTAARWFSTPNQQSDSQMAQPL